MRFFGVDLAWREGTAKKAANETGVAALDESGKLVHAGWTVGFDETAIWIEKLASDDTLLFIDAPLVVNNASGQRVCERQVGQCYGRWQVSANSTNTGTKDLGGVRLRASLEEAGWRYDDGLLGPPIAGRSISECYPYTTLVGAEEFAFRPRPPYKRKPKGLTMAQFWPKRLEAWDSIVARLAALADADPPLDIRSHPATRALEQTPAAGKGLAYKRAEDLLDAVVCAWTAALWWRHGPANCVPLGAPSAPGGDESLVATIIAPVSAERGSDLQPP